MIYLFTGDDSKKRIESLDKFLVQTSLSLEVFQINHNNFSETEIESFYSGSGLFFNKCVVLFSDILEREEEKNWILDRLSEMESSPNFFIFSENKLNKPVLDAFKKLAKGVKVFDLPKEKKEKFNNFLLANALGDRDKLNLWIYFRQAMDKGVGMEELIGVLFWKAKDMILKKNFYKFTKEELQNIANKLSYLLPEARKKGLDDEAVFEKYILEMF